MQGLELTKHVGRVKGTDTRLVVVFKQIPGELLHSLVIYPDHLDNIMRDEVLALVNSRDGQQERDFADALHKRGLLAEMHNKGYLKKISIDEVEMLPNASKPMLLRDLLNQMNEINGVPPLPEQVSVDALSTANPLAEDIATREFGVTEKQAVANSLIFQAQMLETEAKKKRDQAYELVPELRHIERAKTVQTVVETLNKTQKKQGVKKADSAPEPTVKKAKKTSSKAKM